MTVIAVIGGNGKRHFNPGPNWQISSDDELIVTGTSGGVSRLVESFGSDAPI